MRKGIQNIEVKKKAKINITELKHLRQLAEAGG